MRAIVGAASTINTQRAYPQPEGFVLELSTNAQMLVPILARKNGR